MGHPSNQDLARHLKLAGAKDQVVKACHQLACQTCNRANACGSRRPAKVVKPLDFNDEVAVDTMYLYDNSGKKITVLSILGVGSGYHVTRRVETRKADDYAQGFLDAWLSWAGSPNVVLVDQERGLTKDFPEVLEKHGVTVRYTAGQARWQNGHVERQNEWYRHIFDKVKEHTAMRDEGIDWTLSAVAEAKNYLQRRHGHSPAQWLFGSTPRLGVGLVDEEHEVQERQELIPPGDDWHRRNQI